jgi:hypothetical protein
MLPSFASIRDENIPPTRKSTVALVVCQSSFDVVWRCPSEPDLFNRRSDGSFDGDFHGMTPFIVIGFVKVLENIAAHFDRLSELHSSLSFLIRAVNSK